jgi:predicted transcriptional regulator
MAHKKASEREELRFVRLRKVITLVELARHLNCSQRTARRRLAQWQAIHSYNQNGRYYTLPQIADFDEQGLWRCRQAFFSRFGNLPETFAGVVCNSQAGLSAAELGKLLGLRASSFLWSLRKHPAVKKETFRGKTVYFSADPPVREKQRQQRCLNSIRKLPSEFETIEILVEKINHPSLSAEKLSRRLQKRQLEISPELIAEVFVRHGVSEGKRGAPTACRLP